MGSQKIATELKRKKAGPRSQEILAEELYRHINRTKRLLWTAAAHKLEQGGESIFIWQVLCFLVRNGPQTQRDLAYANAQHPAGLSRLLDELEADGLIVRTVDPKDRRRSLVRATPKGKTRFESASPHVWEAVNEALAPLTPKQRVGLRELLGILVPLDAAPKAKAATG